MTIKKNIVLALSLCVALAAPVVAQSRRAAAQSTPATIPQGTEISVRIINQISSETAQSGDRFQGTLATPIVADGKTIFPRGADVSGRVTDAKSSGRLSAPGELELVIDSIRYGSQSALVSVEPFYVKGKSHTKSNTTKIGGGAALGAIIGGIAGGGKGAAIGAGVGAAAGTGAAAATGKKPATIEPEAVLRFVTSRDTTVGGSSATRDQSDSRARLDGAEAARNDAPPLARRPSRSDESGRHVQGDRNAEEYERDDDEYSNDDRRGAAPDYLVFSARDRRVINHCLVDSGSLPPGLAKRDRLPPGLERQLEKNGTLPPGLQKKVRSLPYECTRQLPTLPRDLERVIYGRRVLLIDANSRILDLFDVDEQ